ncbi:MAG: hypothetical protein ABJC39_10625 [Chloroflexota bacterium]
MPELPVKDARLPELHLPEINRDDIMRSLSEIKMPDVDIRKLERPKFDLPDSVTKRDWPSIDIGKAMASAAAAAHIGRKRRSRWPFAVAGLILAGVATAAIVSNQTIRARISDAIHGLRERIAGMQSGYDALDVDRDETVAFDAADTMPIQSSAFAEDSTAGYPDGLGSNGHDDGVPAFEEATSREI